jgi:hypothetical protein
LQQIENDDPAVFAKEREQPLRFVRNPWPMRVAQNEEIHRIALALKSGAA